jgi:hypothetical protein
VVIVRVCAGLSVQAKYRDLLSSSQDRISKLEADIVSLTAEKKKVIERIPHFFRSFFFLLQTMVYEV